MYKAILMKPNYGALNAANNLGIDAVGAGKNGLKKGIPFNENETN